jgi:Zn finger protein HypA/HybF involved in hydrogenase expression
MHAISQKDAPMPIEIRCRQCHQPFTPTTEALRKGPPHWWYCPACRAADVGGETPERIANG